MRGTLVIGKLSVASSYQHAKEEPVEKFAPHDTVQFWISEKSIWRIRTFALDMDIHTHALGGDQLGWLKLSESHIQKNYSDILLGIARFDIPDTSAYEIIERMFTSASMPPYFEVADHRFLFWKPTADNYRTQSDPG